jgi:hypothetical protein
MKIEMEVKCVLNESETEMLKEMIKKGKQYCNSVRDCEGCPFLIGCKSCEACIIRGLDDILDSNKTNCANEETQSQTNHSPCAEEIMRSNY